MNRKITFCKQLFVVALVAITAISCSKKMAPFTAEMFTANPSPLEVVGTKVPVTISGNIPAKWFNENAEVTITPVLKYQGKEKLGLPYTYQGDKVLGNGILISKKTGGNIIMKAEFDYVSEMNVSELYLRFDLSLKGKKEGVQDLKIADGIDATAALANALSTNPSIASDKYQRIIQEACNADIMFMIQQAELRSSELKSGDLTAWKKLVEEASTNDRKYVNVEVSAYASPDGGQKLNDALAEKREKNTTSYLEKEFKKKGIDTEVNARYTAQDWDGFQKLVEASNMQDKDLILRVLLMYPDPETREREIKNISVIYKDLAETILPKLRRSRLTANVEIIGKTEAELKSAITDNINSLSMEELLYAASTIAKTDAEKERIYKQVTTKYPNDYRAWNNLGAIYMQSGLTDKATQMFNRSLQIEPKAVESNMNLAVIALNTNNISKAEQLLGNAAGASNLNEGLGLLYLKKGDYAKAAQSFGDTKSNNAVLAQIMTKNYNQAQEILDAMKTKDATSHYLSAIVSARTNDMAGVVSGIKQAAKLDPSLKEKATKDIEFAKFMANPDVLNMLR